MPLTPTGGYTHPPLGRKPASEPLVYTHSSNTSFTQTVLPARDNKLRSASLVVLISEPSAKRAGRRYPDALTESGCCVIFADPGFA